MIRRFSGTDFCIPMSQSWTEVCFCRAELYHHENICCSCSDTFCDTQLKKVGRVAFNGNMIWPNFSFLMRGVWIAGILSPKCTRFVFCYLQSLWYNFFLSSFHDMICVLLQSFLLYQFSVLNTSFWALSRILFKFRCDLFFCICFCYFCDSRLWEWTHQAYCTILFSLGDNVHVVWTVSFSHFFSIGEAQVIYLLPFQI